MIGALSATPVFLIDSTETCGYSLLDQNKLLDIIKNQFKDTPIVVVEGKSDITKSSSDNINVSCKTKEGIDELKDLLYKKYYPKEEKN